MPGNLNFFEEVLTEPNDYISLREKFPYRPSLFLGVGGIGCLAVSKLKDLFKKTYGEQIRTGTEAHVSSIPPMYKFLGFDSDQNARPTNLLNGDEWYHLSIEDLSIFYSFAGKDKFFKDWIIKDFPEDSIMAGCAGYRNLGRLVFIYNISRVNDIIQRARNSIMAVGDRNLVSRDPVIYFFCSVSVKVPFSST